MYCPKCGSENADAARFCRGCGAEVSRVLGSLQPKAKKPKLSIAEKSVALYSRGVRGVLTSIAFLIVTVIMMTNGEKLWWLGPLSLSLVVMAGAISRPVLADGYKR